MHIIGPKRNYDIKDSGQDKLLFPKHCSFIQHLQDLSTNFIFIIKNLYYYTVF
jgi:hypothetical protein